MMNKEELSHLGTIHRKAERFLGNLHFKRYLQEVLRLDVPYENTEHNRLYIYDNGELTVKDYGDNHQRLEIYHHVQDKLDEIDEPIVHDEFFYSVFESEKDDIGIAIDDNDFHRNLVELLIDQFTKEKEHSLVLYFTQMDNTDENNMYVIRSICVESYVTGNSW